MPEMLETARPAFWTDRPAAARLRPPRQRPVVVDVLAAAAGIGLGVTIGLEVTAESAGSLSAPGGVAIALGRLAGLLAAYAMVVVVLLVARVPPLERAIGQDRLVALAPQARPVAAVPPRSPTRCSSPSATRARRATACCTSSASCCGPTPACSPRRPARSSCSPPASRSYRLARRRMAYETWWSVHLYTYLALFLSFSHQIDTGASFVGHPLARAWWTMLWLGDAGRRRRRAASACRSGARCATRCGSSPSRPEGPGVASIVLRGRRLDRLPVAGGQFFQWRFLRRGLWWQAHPYSLSAAPDGDLLRITVKDLGDHSAGLARLAPGTRVAIEGPYGAFTADTASTDRLLLIGAGRRHRADPRAARRSCRRRPTSPCCCAPRRRAELVLRAEVAAEVQRRGGRLLELVGSREPVRLDAAALRSLVPDVASARSTCAAPSARRTGWPASSGAPACPSARIHFEAFAF